MPGRKLTTRQARELAAESWRNRTAAKRGGRPRSDAPRCGCGCGRTLASAMQRHPERAFPA